MTWLVLQESVEPPAIDPSMLLGAVGILVAAYILARVVTVALMVLGERSPAKRITIKMFVPVARFLIYGVAIYLVLGPLLQLSSAQLLAVSGLAGAAIGFGLRDVFAGFIGGLVLIFEKPYQVGDKVEIGDDYGEVTNIGLRSTQLQTADDTAIIVPNATMFTENVANANDGNPEMMAVVEVSVAPDADLETATRILEDAIVTSRYVYVDDDHPVQIRVSDDTYYRTLTGKAYVADLRDEFAFTSDVTERTLGAFEETGIETPSVPVVSGGDGER